MTSAYKRFVDLVDSPTGNPEGRSILIRNARQMLHVVPIRRSHANADNYDDANWIDCDIQLQAGMFEGRYAAELRSDEFACWWRELCELRDGRTEIAEFSSMEQWLSIKVRKIKGDLFEVAFSATDDSGSPNKLSGAISIYDRTIDDTISDSAAILELFPVPERGV